jgi:hypothetical protein
LPAADCKALSPTASRGCRANGRQRQREDEEEEEEEERALEGQKVCPKANGARTHGQTRKWSLCVSTLHSTVAATVRTTCGILSLVLQRISCACAEMCAHLELLFVFDRQVVWTLLLTFVQCIRSTRWPQVTDRLVKQTETSSTVFEMFQPSFRRVTQSESMGICVGKETAQKCSLA